MGLKNQIEIDKKEIQSLRDAVYIKNAEINDYHNIIYNLPDDMMEAISKRRKLIQSIESGDNDENN